MPVEQVVVPVEQVAVPAASVLAEQVVVPAVLAELVAAFEQVAVLVFVRTAVLVLVDRQEPPQLVSLVSRSPSCA